VSVKIIRDTNFAGIAVLARRVREGDRSVLIGVPKKAGMANEGEMTLAQVAAIHEFGSPEHGIPERSFLRAGITKSLPELKAFSANAIRRVANGGYTVRNALRHLGALAASKVQMEIVNGTFVPNAPSTIKAKGSSKPLIDSGQLRQSITWQLMTKADERADGEE
jgi:hypothetical protein